MGVVERLRRGALRARRSPTAARMTTTTVFEAATFDVAIWASSYIATILIESAVVRIARPGTSTAAVFPAIALLNLVTHPAAWWCAASGIPWTFIEVVATGVELLLWRRFSDWTWNRCVIAIATANAMSAVASFFIGPFMRG